MRKRVSEAMGVATIAAMGMMLTGCQKAATGQVVAVVNGDEITLPELNAELAGLNLPAGVDKDRARAEVLQRMVERRVITQEAKTEGLDRSPDYLIRQRQLNEALLVETYGKRAQDTIRVPDQAAVDRFIAQNPGAFAQRVVFTVDQLRVPPQNKALSDALLPLQSMDAVVALLKSRGVAYDRRPAKIDSAQVDPKTLARVESLPSGKPFIVATPQGSVVSVVTGRQAVPVPTAQARPLAAQMLRNQNLGALLQTRLKDAKAKAKIEYQPGYAPAAPGAAPIAGGTTTKT